MEYFRRFAKKEISSIINNKKLFIITILVQVLIMFLIIRSKELFEPKGFHSINFSINLIILAFTYQFFPVNYFLDKDTGLNNLLILSKTFHKVCYFRIAFYAVVMFLEYIFISFILRFIFDVDIDLSVFYFGNSLFSFFNIAILEMILILVIEEKNLTTLFSFFIGTSYILIESYYCNLSVIRNFFISVLIRGIFLVLLMGIMQVILKMSHKVYK